MTLPWSHHLTQPFSFSHVLIYDLPTYSQVEEVFEVYMLRRSLFAHVYHAETSYDYLSLIIFCSPVFHGSAVADMHTCAYTIVVLGNCISLMQVDVLEAACPYFRLDGKLLSEAADDLDLYSKLSDTIFDLIDNDPHVELKRAKKILNRIYRRDLYVEAGHVVFKWEDIPLSEKIKQEEKITKDIVQISSELGEGQWKLMDDDMIVRLVSR